MKKTISRLHKSQQLRDVKKKSMIFSPEGRSDVIEFLIHHITQLPKCAIYAATSIISIAAVNNTSALSYSDNIGVNFTFDQSLTVSLSSADIVINNLAPGSASDSNVIDVNVLSNNLSGYTLTSTVGNSTHTNPSYDNTNLNHAGNSSNTFASLSTSDSVSDLSTYDTSGLINPNVWGYSYSLDNSTWSNYSGLPKYNDVTNVATLRTSTGPSSETGDDTYFKIAAKASVSQPSGEYRNVINFTVTAEANPVSFYDAFKEAATQPGSAITTLNGYYKMQDMSPSICESVELYDDDSHIQLIDTRDHEVYYIGKLRDNRCWLLDNLRLGSNDYEIPLTPEDTNLAENYTLPKGIIENFNSNTVAQLNASYKDDTNVAVYGLGSGKVGVYYNFCAASGGTYCYPGGSGVGDAEYDVCPARWRIPTGGDNGEYQILYSQYNATQVATNSNSLQYNLSTPQSGIYSDNTTQLRTSGYFWSSTKQDSDSPYGLRISSAEVRSAHTFYRISGTSIRCIADNEAHGK